MNKPSDKAKEISEGKKKAWQVYKKLSEAEKLATGKMSPEDRHRNRVAAARRQEYQTVREIGPLPSIVNAERKAECGQSLELFLRTYFPLAFKLEFSDDHRIVIRKLETSIREGGLFALAMPRGSGKTTISVRAMLWAILYGYRRFGMLIGASGAAAKELLDEIKVELETNDLLLEDFPEVCYPIRKLEGIAQRAKGQTLGGRQTAMEYKGAQIILPTVTDSPASGAIIRTAGITGRVRGAKHTTRDGDVIRPDFVIPDDPQTDRSAQSVNQCNTRERVFQGAILGLAGPGKRIAAVCPCTVIRHGDLAHRLLDKSIHPMWDGERMKMVYAWPTNQALWDTYADLRAADLRDGDTKLQRATAYYIENRKAMDEGSRVAWEQRFEPHEASAIQHAMNLKLKDPEAFEAEYQNEPREQLGNHAIGVTATAEYICQRVNGYQQREIPREATHLVGAVDVQGSCFWYLLLAFNEQFTSWIVDYGIFPDQNKTYVTLQEVDRTIQDMTGVQSLEGSILSGLRRLENHLLTTQYVRDDGAIMPIETLVIDANWGPSTKTVYSFVRQTEQRMLWLPWHGRGVKASQNTMDLWKKKPGEIIGQDWKIVPSYNQGQSPRHIIADTNAWKAFVHARLKQPDGEAGAMTIFKASPSRHRMLADHITAEVAIETQGRGRELHEFQEIPGRDNHLFDCLTMATVGASTRNARLGVFGNAPAAKPKRTLAQMREDALRAKEGR